MLFTIYLFTISRARIKRKRFLKFEVKDDLKKEKKINSKSIQSSNKKMQSKTMES